MSASHDHATTAVDDATFARPPRPRYGSRARASLLDTPWLTTAAIAATLPGVTATQVAVVLVSDLANGLVVRDRFGAPAAWHYALTPAGQAALDHPNYLRRQAHRAANRRRPQLHLLVETDHA